MDYAEENIFKTSLIQEIEGITVASNSIKKEIKQANDYLYNLTQPIINDLTDEKIFKENPIEQIDDINSLLSDIRTLAIHFNELIKNIKLNKLNHLEKNNLNHQVNEIFTTLNIIKEKSSTLRTTIYNALQTKDANILIKDNSINIKNEYMDNIEEICMLNSNILSSLKYAYEVLSLTTESIERLQNNLSDKINLNYIDRFKEETSLIIKKYDNEIKNLTEKFENQFKNFQLDQNEATKSNQLLTNEVNSSLKKLTDLNERTQKIELEFSKIIGVETEKVKEDLNLSRINLMNVIDSITTEANTKLNEIKNAHTDFINLVSNAGIYKLTENYDKKATEEKKQYETYRTYTGRAIGAAIAFTIIILAIPLIEYWGANPPVDTNYYTILARLTISLMFFVLALYFSKQASKHYECYQENHRTFLQLAALEPFMARMTPEEQKEIRKSLVPSYFNQGTDGKFASKGDEVDLPTNMYAIVNRAFDIVSEKKDPKTSENTTAETKPQV